ncbi:MAG: hypothetical protein WC645_08130, partial [Candidatus Margulisiibacteriota bacterium]
WSFSYKEKTMKRVILLIFLLIPSVSYAKDKPASGWEIQPIVGFDVKAIAGQYQGNDSIVGIRFRHSRSLLALELSSNLDHGYGATILIDTVRVWRLRFHLDLGVFYPAWDQMSVPEVPRKYDIVIGAGVEVLLYKKTLAAIFNWRAYLPDPRLIGYYGDFYIPIYKQALKEGAWWLGLGVRF